MEDEREGEVLTEEMHISCCFRRVLALAQKEDPKAERGCESHFLTTIRELL